MHDAAWRYVASIADRCSPSTAVDIGGRDVNGTCRDLFPETAWTVLDAQPGPGVDVVADGGAWLPTELVDLVLCTEVFEHTPRPDLIVDNIAKMLRPGGRVILTMAGPGRAPHGIRADDPLQPGWYKNIEPIDLGRWLEQSGFIGIEVDQLDEDVRATAVR